MFVPSIIRKYLKKKWMEAFYSKFVGKGDLCFDIGANIGERTNIFLNLKTKVVAIEPQKACFEILNAHFARNKNVELLNLAIGSSERDQDLMICDEHNECATLSKDFVSAYSKISNFHWSATEKIKVKSLQSICEEYGRPKLCKIDVEGYESEVLLGLKEPIKFICFEFNKPLLNDTLKTLDLLSALGNYQCNFIKYEHMKVVLPRWIPISDFRRNISEFISDDILTGEIIAECLDL